MKTPHKHAELIKAWADGAEIEVKGIYAWNKTDLPVWLNDDEYRIKPEPKPDVVRYGIATRYFGKEVAESGDNIKAIFCGETGKLKSAEVMT